MATMPTLELVFRIAAITELSLLAVLLWRQAGGQRHYRPAALLLGGIGCYLLAPLAVYQWQWGLAALPIIAVAIIVPALFWYFVNAVFNDKFRARPWMLGLAIATGIAGLLEYCNGAGAVPDCQCIQVTMPEWTAQGTKLLWVIAAVVVVLKDWQADLVAPRRRVRLLIVLLGGCYIGIVLLVELLVQGPVATGVELLNVALLAAAVTALFLHFISTNADNVFARIAPAAAAAPAVTPEASPGLSTLATQVVRIMEEERAFASEALTVGSLAKRLQTQPYQLRNAINGELGYRNFNAFINRYRVEEVALRLAQAQYRDTPLLTLALDAGFRSLAPFNSSFKEHYGMTPSAYRQTLNIPK